MSDPDSGPESGGSSPSGRGDLPRLLARHSDLALAALVVLIVAMMIVPLPPLLLDLLLALNIGAAVTLLLMAIYVSDALKIAAFPALLLLTTLFRLALQVSATRLVLLEGDAGALIAAFGGFVVAGNVVVGAVVFAILAVIQFLVISKGAERVAEVGARFTLDAMPGKQMAIDAELRAGHIDGAEARRRRALLGRESQFFGAMDGAMKFVKGDAVAGIVILLTNIVGGLVIGVLQRDLDLATAARTYTILTIGEGLVAQIPALVISTAAGIVVTRVSSEEEGAHLGREILGQLLAQPKALAISATLLGLLALVPGLPTLPFVVLAGALGFVASRLIRAARSRSQRPPGGAAGIGGSGEPRAGADEAARAPVLTPIAVELGAGMADVLPADGGRLLGELVPRLRARVFEELGLPLPQVRLRRNVPGVPARGYVIRLREVPMGRGELLPGGGLAQVPHAQVAERGIAAHAAVLPDGAPGAWIPGDQLLAAKERGIATLTPEEVVTMHLLLLVRRHGHEFVGVQETQALLDALEATHPALVREVVPKMVSPVLLADVLGRLAEEGVSLRALPEILGALARWAPVERDPVILTEHVRAGLGRQIASRHAAPDGSLSVYLLDPLIEETIREAIRRTPTGSYLALEPALSRDINAAVGRSLAHEIRTPVLLTNVEIRRFLRRLVETEHPRVAVLSYQELAPETRLQPLGRITVEGERAAAPL
jgi:type III secretion protein V